MSFFILLLKKMRINKINCLILKEMTCTIDLLYKLFLRCHVVFQKQFFLFTCQKIQTIKSGYKEVVRIQIIHQLKAIGSRIKSKNQPLQNVGDKAA